MRAFFTILGLFAALVSPATGQTPAFDDPRELIESIYAPYQADEIPSDYPKDQFSPTLRQLWDGMEARSDEAEMPILDFDPFINGQDFDIADFSVADPLIEGDTAIVIATFLNFSTPQEMRFTLVRGAAGWKIDDLESLGSDFTYRLSELLAADPLLN
jgi:hypothetical protein